MFNGVRKNEIVIAAAIVVGASLAIGGWFYLGMKPGRGLRINAPDLSSANNSTSSAPANNLDQVGSASFMAAMGLEISPKKTVETATASAIASAPMIIASATPAIVKPSQTNLDALGYRLRGIVLEDRRSAAFVFVPAEKKVVVIRENASGTIRLLEAGMRSVKLQTPEGTGVLNLENARQTPGSQGSSPSGNIESLSPADNRATPESAPGALSEKKIDRQPAVKSGPGAIAGSINQGQLKLLQQRGKFSVEVREIPEALKGYELKTGDKIIGTDAGEFGKPQDVAINLGSAGGQARNLLIQRDGKTMTLQAPPPPARETTSPADNAATDPLKNPAAISGRDRMPQPPANPAINNSMPPGGNPPPGNNTTGTPPPAKP